MICAFTGHRPQRLPWGSCEDDPRCIALKQMIASAVDRAADLGFTTFLCGMARGCDTFFAEAVIQKMQDRPEISLIAMVPCPEQPDKWSKLDRSRYRGLLEKCSAVEILEPVYKNGCMLRRNRAMVDRAQMLISVYDGGGGGTGQTVRLAEKSGLEIIPLWL